MRAFWTSTSVLLNFRRPLVFAVLGSILSAASFGAGVGMMKPFLQLLLSEADLSVLIQAFSNSHFPVFLQSPATAALQWIPSEPFAQFVLVLALLSTFGLAAAAGRYLHEASIAQVVFQSSSQLREEIFRHSLRLPWITAQQEGTSSQLSRLMADVNSLSRGFDALLGKGGGYMLRGLACLLLALWISWPLTTVMLACAPLIVLLCRAFNARIRRSSHQALEGYGVLTRIAQEAMLGLIVVKAHTAEEQEQRRFEEASREVARQEIATFRSKAASSSAVEIISLFGVGGAAGMAAWIIFYGNVAPVDFLVVLTALIIAGQALQPLTRLTHELSAAQAAALRLQSLLQIEPESSPVSAARASRYPANGTEIHFQQVSFFYPTKSEAALEKVDLLIPAGSLVSIVGPNGAGKTTLLSLIPRLLQPSAGRIMVGGLDTAEIELEALRQKMVFVPQENFLFHGSIAENIAYGNPAASRRQIIEAAQAAYAHDFIAALPQGYDTRLAELGRGLSAGQRQRLTIARALLRDPSVLILDEPTSQLDKESELKIQTALDEMRGRRTVVVAGHRFNLELDADLTVRLEGGRVAAATPPLPWNPVRPDDDTRKPAV